MKTKTMLLYGLPALAAGMWIAIYLVHVFQRGSPVNEDEIHAAIKKANYCTVEADCGISPFQCHFVEQLVNVREIPNIAYLQRRYLDWGGACNVREYSGVYDFKRRYCSSGKCVAPRIGELIVEPRPIPPTPAGRLPVYEK